MKTLHKPTLFSWLFSRL